MTNCEAIAPAWTWIVTRGTLHARSECSEAQEVALVLRQILDLRRRDVGRNGLGAHFAAASAGDDDCAAPGAPARRLHEVDDGRLADEQVVCWASRPSTVTVYSTAQPEDRVIAGCIDSVGRALPGVRVDRDHLRPGSGSRDVSLQRTGFGLRERRRATKRNGDCDDRNAGRQPTLGDDWPT